MKRALTVKLAAHHGDLQRLEVALHEGLTLVQIGPNDNYEGQLFEKFLARLA